MAGDSRYDDVFFLPELLTDAFYEWERHGRGWERYNFPVALEPPFIPFEHEFPPERPILDDGARPSLLSRVARGLWRMVGGGACSKDTFPGFPLRLPRPLDGGGLGALRFARASLTQGVRTSPTQVEQFLLSLRSCRNPVSFEVVGLADAVYLQFACADSDFSLLTSHLGAFFPDATFQPKEDAWPKEVESRQAGIVVDFGLAHEFMRPLATFHGLDPDPLTSVFGVLSSLQPGEAAVFQVLMQTAVEPWAASIMQAVTLPNGEPFFADVPEMLPLAKEKVAQPLFAVVVRALATAPVRERAWSIGRNIASCLQRFSRSGSNELIPLDDSDYDPGLHAADIRLRQTRRPGMLLNAGELVGLVHPLAASVRIEKLFLPVERTRVAPALAHGHELVLGLNVHQGRTITATLSAEQRLRHMHVIGATGTGKSTFLLNLIGQDLRHGHGVAVLDPHGDLIEKVLACVPENRYGDVVLLDPSDSEFPVGLNILEAHSEIERTVLASDLIAVFRRLSSSWGDQMNSVFGNAILAFLESRQGGTLVDLRRFLVEKEYRTRFLTTVIDPEVVYYWEKEFPMLIGKAQAPILTRLDTFLRPKVIRNMVSQKKGFDFGALLNGRKILLAKLSQGLIGHENAYLLGTLLVSKLHQMAMARQAESTHERKHFYLYVDEFQNFLTPSMADLLSGARKYRLGLVLAHQDMRQLWERDKEVAHSVISNPGTRVCFRLGDFDAARLEEGFASFDTQDLKNLGIGQAIARIERTEFDFNLTVPPPEEMPPAVARERAARIKALSRERYASKPEEAHQEATAATQEPAPPPVDQTPLPTPPAKTKKVKVDAPSGLTEEEIGFLEGVAVHPDFFVTRLYKVLHLSGYKGDKVKTTLIEEGYLVQEEIRSEDTGKFAKVLRLTEKGQKVLEAQPKPGKGGAGHRRLQEMLAEQAKLFGWQPKIEERIPGTRESVDVGLSRADLRVAIEISDTTTPDHEAGNLGKCLDAGYDYVLCVSEDPRHLAAIKRDAKAAFLAKDRERLKFVAPNGVVKTLAGIVSGGIVSENGVVSALISVQKQRDDLLDMAEAASILGISKYTLYEWISQKKIAVHKVGTRNKFKRKDLEAWLEKRRQDEERTNFDS